MENYKIKAEVNTKEIDAAIEKSEKLVSLLKEANSLVNELAK